MSQKWNNAIFEVNSLYVYYFIVAELFAAYSMMHNKIALLIL